MAEINLLTQLANENERKPDMKYLLQIHREKIIDYLHCGLILPDRYLSNDYEKDIQSKNSNFLVFGDGYIQELDEYQIFIELILTDEEKKHPYDKDKIFYRNTPLPISRIKKIYVQDKEVMLHIQGRIENSDCGFLPKELFDVYKNGDKIKFNKIEYLPLSEDIKSTDFTEQIRKYDKRMGMFAFMKNTNLYYSDHTNFISNYSEHYFSALSLLLKENMNEKSFCLYSILEKNEEFKTLLYSDTQINKEFLIKIAEEIEDIELKEIFVQLQKNTGRRNLLSLLLKKGAINLYLIGLVYYLREKDTNKKNNFKIGIQNLIPYEVAEVSLAILGIYFGYKNISASENIQIKDKIFNKFFGGNVPMKFTMKSKLEYIMMESIYNLSFKDQKGYEYEYLPYPEQPNLLKLPTDKTFERWYEVQINTTQFDAQFLKITKKSFEKQIDEKLENHGDKLNSSKDGILIGYILKRFPSSISPILFGEKLEISCNKDEFKKVVLQEQNQTKQDEILDLIELNRSL